MTAEQLLGLIERVIDHRVNFPDETPFEVHCTPYAQSADGSQAYELEIRGRCSDGSWGLISSETIR